MKKKKKKSAAFAGATHLLRSRAEDSSAHLAYLMAEADKAVASILHGDHRQRKSGGGENFWQFREYHPGDRPQDIDWRQSGRGDRVFIRQKEWQTNQSCFLWCSNAPGMNFNSDDKIDTKADTAKIITLALSLLLTHAGEEIGWLGEPQKGKSEAALQKITERLQGNKNMNDLPEDFTPPKNSSIFLLGDFLSPIQDIEKKIKDIAGQSDSGFVIQILDPAEINLPYDGRVVFERPGSQERVLMNNVSSIRTAYQKRIDDHINNVRTLCRNAEWQYILHVTNTDIRDTLLGIWTSLNLHTACAGTLQR